MKTSPVLAVNEFEILRLWRARHDTAAIAERMGLSEHVVANALAKIMDRGHLR